MSQQTEKPKESPRCSVERFQASDFDLGRFSHRTAVGVTRKHLLDPEYWAHVAETMTPYSEITVRNDEGIYYAKYLVLECSRGWAKVQELGWWNLTTADVAATQSHQGNKGDYSIEFKGQTRKWLILRKSDQQVMNKETLDRKEMAEAWLTNFLSTRAHQAVIDGHPA